MKKLNLIFIALLLLLTLVGCNIQDARYINFSVKPNNHYYTDELKNNLINNKNFTLSVFDTNLYKEIEVPKDENPVIENFISCLTNENYSDEPINKKESFRVKIAFDDNIYLIKVFDNSMIAISPWDGNYKEDIVSIKDLPLRYNLWDFCNHILNYPISNQSK